MSANTRRTRLLEKAQAAVDQGEVEVWSIALEAEAAKDLQKDEAKDRQPETRQPAVAGAAHARHPAVEL